MLSVYPLSEIINSPYVYVWNDPVDFADPTGMIGERKGGSDSCEPSSIRFDVTNFNPLHHKQGISYFEFNHILSNPALLQKTTFIRAGNVVIWNGTQFINK